MLKITPAEAATNIFEHIKDRTLCQRNWRITTAEKEYTCLLAAIHPDINKVGDCPTTLMPQWLADVTVTLFDAIPQENVYPIATKYANMLANGAISRLTNDIGRRYLTRAVSLKNTTPLQLFNMLLDEIETLCLWNGKNEHIPWWRLFKHWWNAPR